MRTPPRLPERSGWRSPGSVSRGAHDAKIFTNDREKLPEALSRDISHQSAHVPEVQQEPKPEPQRERLSGRELLDQYLRHWTPLKEALPAHEAKQFAWKQESGTMQICEHMQTGRHLYIDGQEGQFLDRNRDPISPKEGLDHAMPRATRTRIPGTCQSGASSIMGLG